MRHDLGPSGGSVASRHSLSLADFTILRAGLSFRYRQPFKSISHEPWSKVKEMVKAA
jgi:hypothetical protein